MICFANLRLTQIQCMMIKEIKSWFQASQALWSKLTRLRVDKQWKYFFDVDDNHAHCSRECDFHWASILALMWLSLSASFCIDVAFTELQFLWSLMRKTLHFSNQKIRFERFRRESFWVIMKFRFEHDQRAHIFNHDLSDAYDWIINFLIRRE